MAELLQCIKSCDLYAEDAAECLADACSAACTVVRSRTISHSGMWMRLRIDPKSNKMTKIPLGSERMPGHTRYSYCHIADGPLFGPMQHQHKLYRDRFKASV